MIKRILKLNGAQVLTNNEQRNIKGARTIFCCEWCPDGSCLDWSDGGECPISAGCPA